MIGSVSVSVVHANPEKVSFCAPWFVIIKALVRDVVALPTTRPPKSTSRGARLRKGLELTVVPCRLMGNVVAYFGTALMVVMVSTEDLTPGFTAG